MVAVSLKQPQDRGDRTFVIPGSEVMALPKVMYSGGHGMET